MSWHIREEIKIHDAATLSAGLQGRLGLLRDAMQSGKGNNVVAVARWMLRCVYGSDMKAAEELRKFADRDTEEEKVSKWIAR